MTLSILTLKTWLIILYIWLIHTISEIDAKKLLNALNEIKKAEIIKYKKRTSGHKKLLNLFDDLSDIILTDKTLESQENED